MPSKCLPLAMAAASDRRTALKIAFAELTLY
jgi:hypothetical protein